MIPQGDYFKHTTRRILSDAQKQETIAAIERAAQYLGRMASTTRIEHVSLQNGREVFRSMNNSMVYFSRWVNLVKGGTQPRRLYRRTRRYQVEVEARRIANETGADYSEVRREFLELMNKYISEEP